MHGSLKRAIDSFIFFFFKGSRERSDLALLISLGLWVRETSALKVFPYIYICYILHLVLNVDLFNKSVLSSLGGTLGLFCGLSLVGVVEVAFWLLKILFQGLIWQKAPAKKELEKKTKRLEKQVAFASE